MSTQSFTLFLLICHALYLVQCNHQFERLLKASCIIPDLLDTAPEAVLHVRYGPGAMVLLGNSLPLSRVSLPPVDVRWSGETGVQYTLLMSDLDPPNRTDPYLRELLHWLVVNIPGHTATGGNLSQGLTPAQYTRPAPEEGQGSHRYVFMLYKQTSPITSLQGSPIDAQTITPRLRFNSRQFTRLYNLTGPIAGNFFRAHFDRSH